MDIVSTIVSFIQLAMQAAPAVKTVYDDGKALIQTLFSKGVITADEQAQYMAWSDAHMYATLTGQQPPEFQVIPLPVPITGGVVKPFTPPAGATVTATDVSAPAGTFGGSASELPHNQPQAAQQPATELGGAD